MALRKGEVHRKYAQNTLKIYSLKALILKNFHPILSNHDCALWVLDLRSCPLFLFLTTSTAQIFSMQSLLSFSIPTMAEQHFPQTRPFMSKETFDEVSFEMWGRSDYDYHASYIASRMEWYDDDIREEALYASGMAYGLRLAALERTSQPIRHQNGYRDQSSALSDEGGCQFGCTSQCDPRYGEHYCYASHLSQTMAQTPTSQSSRPVLPVSGVARTPSESAALQRQASMFNDGSAPRQDSRDYANGYYGTERPYAKTFSSSH